MCLSWPQGEMGKSGERGAEGEPGIKVPKYLHFLFCLYSFLPSSVERNALTPLKNRSDAITWYILRPVSMFEVLFSSNTWIWITQGRTGIPGVIGLKGLKVKLLFYFRMQLFSLLATPPHAHITKRARVQKSAMEENMKTEQLSFSTQGLQGYLGGRGLDGTHGPPVRSHRTVCVLCQRWSCV